MMSCIVGSEGSTATFSQSSGSVKVLGLAAPPPHGSFNLGRQAGTKGTYTQSSGSVDVTGDGFIGQAGEGIYNQTSGSVKFTGPFTLADAGFSKGTYNMNSGSLTSNHSSR